jgi:hypothetical protein
MAILGLDAAQGSSSTVTGPTGEWLNMGLL